MELLPVLLATELPPHEHASRLQELFDQLKHIHIAVLPIVTSLGPYLTSSDDAARTRAITLLAEIIAEVPQIIQSAGDVQHLATFFTGRLTDWPAIRASLSGCLALLNLPKPSAAAAAAAAAADGEEVGDVAAVLHGPQGAVALAAPDVVQMMSTFAGHVFVRSLGQQDRCLALSLLDRAMEVHGQALLDSRQVDLLEVVIASLDGEKDPRALLLALRCVRRTVGLFEAQPATSLHRQRLEEAAEELLDVTAAYFPVSFTPPPNDPHGITRAQLAANLEATLAATPLFAEHLLPLLLEKLGASLRQAKLDSLSALGACAQSWGFAPLAGHISAMWGGLRAELLPAAGAAAGGPVPGTPVGGGDDDVQAAAAKCLSQCLEAFSREGHCELLEAVWADAAVQDLFACLPADGAREAGGATFARRVGRVRATTRVLAAVCQAGQAAASRLCQLALPKVLPLCTIGQPVESPAARESDALISRCLALGVLLTLLQAAGGSGEGGQAFGAKAALAAGGGFPWQLPLLEGALRAALEGLPPRGGDGAPAEVASHGSEPNEEPWGMERGWYTPGREAGLRLWVVRALFSLPGAARQLAKPLLESAGGALVACILGGSGSATSATLGSAEPAGPAVQQQAGGLAAAATAALCALAADGSHAELVAQHALPPIAAAAAPDAGAVPAAGAGTRRAALAALRALAGSHPDLRAAALAHLDASIQRLLPAAVAEPRGPASAAAAEEAGAQPSALVLAEDLLQAAQSVLAARGESPGDGEVAPLARHLYDAIMTLPESQAGAEGVNAGLFGACAYTIFQGVRLADEPAQRAFLEASGCMPRLQQAASRDVSDGSSSGPAGAARTQRSVGALQLAACASLLAGLRPGALAACPGVTAHQLEGLLGALLSQALAQGQEGSDETGAGAASWAALAAASALNKWKPDSAELHRATHALLERHLFPLTVGAPGVPEPETSHALLAASPQGTGVVHNAWACLGLVAKGLVMRGHPAGDGVLAGVLGLLSEAEAELAGCAGASAGAVAGGAPALEGGADVALEPGAGAWPAEQGGLIVREAARLFGDILRSPVAAPQPGPGMGSQPAPVTGPSWPLPGLSPEAHAVARPLWQQRFFTVQSAALLRALRPPPPSSPATSAAAAGNASGCLGEGEGEGPASPLTLALSHLIGAAPSGVLRADWPRMLPWVPRCLAAVLGGWRQRRGAASGAGGAGEEGADSGLVLALLDAMCEALMVEEGRRLCAEGLLPQLVPALLGALQYGPCHHVRERAAQALLLLVQLPYAVLHPYKGPVVKGLLLALDDNKRVVRLQAAQARQAWLL